MDKKSQENYKVQMYELVRMFVRAYQRRYYIQYKGDIDDLASDFYLEFMTPKARELGKEQSLLDKFDPNVTTLPYLVKVSVIRMLIDRSRSDKGEINYTEKYDEETGELSLDYIANHIDEEAVQLEDIQFSEEEIFELRDLYDNMPEKKKQEFLDYYQQVKNVLSPNFRALFKDLTNEEDWNEYSIKVEGKAPNYKAVVYKAGKKKEERDYRAAHSESALKKIKKDFPEVEDIEIV